MRETKKFAGKVYYFKHGFDSKAEAMKFAARIRRLGMLARVTPDFVVVRGKPKKMYRVFESHK